MSVKVALISGVLLVQSEAVTDHRGSLTRVFCRDELRPVLGARQIVQINHSLTQTVGAVRGMHFQRPPHAEMKLVRCMRGKVWDVVVDLRAGSSTFLRWCAHELAAGSGLMLVVPEGCAHGFQVLEPDSELLYLHTASYTPSAEGGLHPSDPALAISWPLPITDISQRDRDHPLIDERFRGITI